ncbi:hypothetical protein FACS1894130_02500 [Spirochaetia bacterium]|nr:hypothetical protein FACS1894130_02500 [Spirochaetia bacterium]
MKRKKLVMIVLMVLGGATVLMAQPEKPNTISVGFAGVGVVFGDTTRLSGPGLGIAYERAITRIFSLGLETFGDFSFEINTYNDTSWFRGMVGAQTRVKWYPAGGPFFADLGLGYAWEVADVSRDGFLVSPEAGGKIDPGNPDGFVIIPVVSVPVFIGKDKGSAYGSSIDVGLVCRISLGFVF